MRAAHKGSHFANRFRNQPGDPASLRFFGQSVTSPSLDRLELSVFVPGDHMKIDSEPKYFEIDSSLLQGHLDDAGGVYPMIGSGALSVVDLLSQAGFGGVAARSRRGRTSAV